MHAPDPWEAGPTCPDLETLAAYREGRQSEAIREALTSHAAVCGRCRELLWQGDPELRTRRSARDLAYAAAVLLALGASVWVLGRPGRGSAPDPTLPRMPVPSAAGFLGSREAPEAFLGRGVDILVEQGGRLAFGRQGLEARLEAGGAWLEADGAEPLALALPSGTLLLRRGVVHVELASSASLGSWALASAWAVSPARVAIRLLEGDAEFQDGIRIWPIPGGTCAILGEGQAVSRTPLSKPEIEALVSRRLGLVSALPGRDLLGAQSLSDGQRARAGGRAPSAGYRWVLVLRKRQASSELGVTFPVDGVWYQWVLGLAGRPPRARETVALCWDGESLRISLDGRRVLRVPREKLRELLRPAPEGWEVAVWGGRVRIDQAILSDLR